jgi:uncharacterized membrane protein YhiD involved in acid resistance
MKGLLENLITSGGFGLEHLTTLLSAMLLTLMLSSLLVFTYDKTTPPVTKSSSLMQALLLMSMVTAMIMQSIGDSLALSFGIFGALAIIRFRSNISDLRDIAFLFATMAIGIACGVHSFTNAILGTLFFCGIIFLIKLSPFDTGFTIRGVIRIELPDDLDMRSKAEACMNTLLRHVSMVRFRVVVQADGTKYNEYEYSFIAGDLKSGSLIKAELERFEGVNVTRISFDDGSSLGGNSEK